MLMDSMAKAKVLKDIESEIAKVKDRLCATRPTGDPNEQATTWWNRGQVYALEQLATRIKDEQQD
jgi:hypothetical protein